MEMQTHSEITLHPLIVKLLKKRGLQNDQIKDFFSWDLKKLPEFGKLKDLNLCCERILDALANEEKIAIYGDYDVDGSTSCALFFHFFKMINTTVKLYQPSRFVEGYGIHPSSIEEAHKDGINVLITVDCGITNDLAALKAKELGIDLIITDHHQDKNETMPEAFAIVNPNRRDEDHQSPLASLAGVGVAFAVCLRLRQMLIDSGQTCPTIYPLLQFVAIGTICDMANLNQMNRVLVRHGLKQMPQSQYPGLLVFLSNEERLLPMIPSEKLAFQIGPVINSKGRLDHPELALNLLISDDLFQAHDLLRQLQYTNQQRKKFQEEVFKEALAQARSHITDEDHPIHIVYSPKWHEGVVGIVASKLVETFHVPAVVLTNTPDGLAIKGSARSAGELNIFEELSKCAHLFTKFGGHKKAAGLTTSIDHLDEIRKTLIKNLKSIPAHLRRQDQYFDEMVTIDDITVDLAKNLEQLEPFGEGNQRPKFRMDNFQLEKFEILKELHVRWCFSGIKNKQKKIWGISFNYIGKPGNLHPEELLKKQKIDPLQTVFTVGINRFKSQEYLQLMVDTLQT